MIERPRTRVGWLLLSGSCLIVSCGKSRVAVDVEPWEPATEANGFRSVELDDAHTAPCVNRREPFETRAHEKTMLAMTSRAKAIVADESHVYFIDTQEKEDAVIDGPRLRVIGGTTIERLALDNGGRRRIAVPEGVAQDLAVDRTSVYWSTRFGASAHAIWAWDKETEHVRVVALDDAGRLVARGSLVAWTRERADGVGEVRSVGSPSAAHPPNDLSPTTVAKIPDLVPAALAIEGTTIYAASKDAIWAVPTIGDAKPRKIAHATYPPEDLAVDAGWVWWIEQGPARAFCSADGSKPIVIGHRGLQRPLGMLKRVRIEGGPNDVLATDLADVHKLTVHRNIAWIATPYGVLRVLAGTEPTREPLRSTVRLAATDEGLIGARYDMGQQEITLLRVRP